MSQSYTFVLYLSEECQKRIASGIYPEVLDAIAEYRECKPGSAFIIPVRLSDCEIPGIEIDGSRTLNRLHYIDLFPASERADGLANSSRPSGIFLATLSRLIDPSGALPVSHSKATKQRGQYLYIKCNRSRQASQFQLFFRPNIEQRPGLPQFYLLHGEAGQCHQSWESV
jgi:hypothetical protein